MQNVKIAENICEKFYNTLDKCRLCKPRLRDHIIWESEFRICLTWWEYALIDKDDFYKCYDYCWYLSKRWYVESRIWWKLVKMHRFILNPSKDEFIDHINRDRIDNRKSNLRICTKTENNRNKTHSKRSKTWIKWVYFNKKINKFVVQVTKDRIRYSWWTHSDINSATIAVNKLTYKLHWDFSNQY